MSQIPVQYLSLAILLINIAQLITTLAIHAKGRANDMSEYSEQCCLVEWCAWNSGKYPELDLIFAVPNGEKRDLVTGARLKKAGVKAGVCDIILPVARGGYHSLAIEMKTGKGQLSPVQRWWMAKLREQGWLAVVCRSADEAIAVITEYLNGKVANPSEQNNHIGYKHQK